MKSQIGEILKRGARRFEEAAQAADHLAALVFLHDYAGAERHRAEAAHLRGEAAIAMAMAGGAHCDTAEETPL